MLQRKLNFGIRKRISKSAHRIWWGGRIWAWHTAFNGQHFAALKLPISCLTELLKSLGLVRAQDIERRSKVEGRRTKDEGRRQLDGPLTVAAKRLY